MTILCAYCGRDITGRGKRRTDHEGRAVCRRSCSWHPRVITKPAQPRQAAEEEVA